MAQAGSTLPEKDADLVGDPSAVADFVKSLEEEELLGIAFTSLGFACDRRSESFGWGTIADAILVAYLALDRMVIREVPL